MSELESYGMQIPLEWQMPGVVLGLVLALLLASALVRRYQEHKAYQRARLRAVLMRIGELEQALAQLEKVPLSEPLRQALYDYLHREYLTVSRLNRSYPDIQARLEQTAQQVATTPGASGGRVPAVEDSGAFQRLLEALDVLAKLLAHSGPYLKEARRHLPGWRQEVGERRAELMARFYIVRAHREEARGNMGEARQLLHGLLEQLHQRGPDTPFVRELYQEAEGLFQRVTRGLPMNVDETSVTDAAESAA
jgi:hypothetical protein